ncbi:MAG: hypothetical protein ABMA13_18365 [Chthoniobacteraceae bacterium]
MAAPPDRFFHAIDVNDETGEGCWPVTRTPGFTGDALLGLVEAPESPMLIESQTDPRDATLAAPPDFRLAELRPPPLLSDPDAVPSFHPLGLSFDQAHEINFRVRQISVTCPNGGGYIGARHHNRSGDYTPRQGEEYLLDRWPGMSVVNFDQQPEWSGGSPNHIVLGFGVITIPENTAPFLNDERTNPLDVDSTLYASWPVLTQDVMSIGFRQPEGDESAVWSQGYKAAVFYRSPIYPYERRIFPHLYYSQQINREPGPKYLTVSTHPWPPPSIGSTFSWTRSESSLDFMGLGLVPLYELSLSAARQSLLGNVKIEPIEWFGYAGRWVEGTGRRTAMRL